MGTRTTMDGNTAVAHVAYRVNEVCAIFPITPSSTMAELADQWSAEGLKNIWGNVPVVQEMQSEGGAAGAVHGALQSGAMTTTFTASQGLMLMLPNMFKIAGELTPTVFHVAARSLATSALSIFGDHSDVMTARATGFALISSGNVQEAHDAALIAQAATLQSRVPFLHFFDGFRTSHELNTLSLLSDDDIRSLIPNELVRAHRSRALNPEHPFIRGTAHNPDTFFQAREAVSPFYAKAPAIVAKVMAQFDALTGRRYGLFEYEGAADAERVLVLMGSGAETARQTVMALVAKGAKVGVLQVRLYRPFSAADFLAALPASVTAIAVLEQTKEPGSPGEPLYLDVVVTLAEAVGRGERASMPQVVGGRYGISSKDFTPAMAKAALDELLKRDANNRFAARNGFTVGINDDVSHTSLEIDPGFSIEADSVTRAVFYGLGADGTVGANKNSVKIIAEDAGRYAQGYFVYDSHKSGAQTISHLRFGPDPIKSPYLIAEADFVACHQAGFLERQDVLRLAAPGGVFLLNAPYGPDEVFDELPRPVQRQIIDKRLRFFVIDASKVAREVGLPGRTNTILQTCFFAISGVLPREAAIRHIKESIRKTYGRKGDAVVAKNFAAVDGTLARLYQVEAPAAVSSERDLPLIVPDTAPDFVRRVTARMMVGRGDDIPVSLMPPDGTFPSGTSAYEKRNIAEVVPVWEEDLCIQCGQCSFVCPHSVIRARYYHEDALAAAPRSFKSAPVNARGYPEARFSLQFYVEDCTGCGLCVEACPAVSPREPGVKAINLTNKESLIASERVNISFFEKLPVNDRARVDFANVRGVQFLEPLFEFSGACAGCGETPYLKLLSQLFGDRAQIANATGCSFDLRRQPAGDAMDEGPRGPRAGMVKFAVRGQCRVRAGLSAGCRQASRTRPDAAPSARGGSRRGPCERHRHGSADPGVRDPGPADPGRRTQDTAPQALRRGCPRSPLGRRSSCAAEHLDRRWRRLGLRHRLWRTRPRDGERSRRQRPGARYRGLFQHRRPGVEGDAPRSRGQVRDRRQARRAQGPRPPGDRLWQCLRCASRHGRQPATDTGRVPRGGSLRRNIPDPGL